DGTAVTAVPDTGYSFVNWSDASTDNPRQDLAVTGDITVTANFAINTYTLTYNAGAGGSISGTTPQTVDYGSDGTAVTAVPDTGYSFVNWSDASTDNPRTDTNVTANVNVTATFSEDQYTLTINTVGSGSVAKVPDQATYTYGTVVTLTANPDVGWSFDSWSGDMAGSTNPDTITMNGNRTVTATFTVLQYTVTASADANGTIDPNGAIVVNYGTDQLFTATANLGHEVDTWYLDANSVQTGSDTYTLGNITADHTVYVIFKTNLFDPRRILDVNITMDAGDWDTLRFSCPGGWCGEPPHPYWPATLECGDLGIGPMLVGIRRKNDVAEPSEADPQKVSLKIDINRFAPGQLFAGKKKLSLENGSEMAIVTEALSWNIYQAAGFISGRAAWCKVYVNGSYKGLYANVEQVDKVFLTDNGIDNGGFLWKDHELLGQQQRTRELETSPFNFNWYPFDHPDYMVETIPPPVDWRDQALWRVDMPHILTLAAAENFISNQDAAIQKNTNYWYYDWSTEPNDDPNGQQPRLYFPWDLDTTLKGGEIERGIIDQKDDGHMWEGLIEELDEAGVPFAEPTFQDDYLDIYTNLLDGPLELSKMLTLVNNIESVIVAEVDADPYTHLTDVNTAEWEFKHIRDFLTARTAYVTAQLELLLPLPGIVLFDDGFEGTPWDANWTGAWTDETTRVYTGSHAAGADRGGGTGYFTSDALDADDATAIHIDFYFQQKMAATFTLEYNGSG
ncbi:MAG: CotH kinase family protein, partial [Dehalococcoidales bacterium]